jgi:hypothetical protein
MQYAVVGVPLVAALPMCLRTAATRAVCLFVHGFAFRHISKVSLCYPDI